jgi:glycosyl transferase family 1
VNRPLAHTIDKSCGGVSALVPTAEVSAARDSSTFAPVLVRTRSTELGQFLHEIHQFEDTIEECTDWKVVNGPALPRRRWSLLIVAALAAALRFIRSRIAWKSKKYYLSIGFLFPVGLQFKTFPYFDVPARFRVLWTYDMWESELPKLLAAVEAHDIKLIFVSSQQATERLNEISNGRYRCYWVPEAIRVEKYRFKPMSQRRIDVLQLGRCWKEYHYHIEEFCRDKGIVYRYQKKNEVMYSTRPELVEGLADSRISICVPRAITHPESAGDISTLTYRYLESMASKCVVLGRAPLELKELFDYDPIIEIDLDRAGEQLLELLRDLPRYEGLIERNYEHVRRHHQWTNRISAMEKCFADFEKRFIIDD